MWRLAQPRAASRNLTQPQKSGSIGTYITTTRTSLGVRTLFDQSEHGYSVRHRVYVRFSTNQSMGIAYVTGCTHAFRPTRARCSRILISAAPCGGLRNLAQPHATSRSLKKKARSAFIILTGVVLTRTAISWYPELVIFAVNILQPVKKAETPCVM